MVGVNEFRQIHDADYYPNTIINNIKGQRKNFLYKALRACISCFKKRITNGNGTNNWENHITNCYANGFSGSCYYVGYETKIKENIGKSKCAGEKNWIHAVIIDPARSALAAVTATIGE